MGHFLWPVTCAHMGKQLNSQPSHLGKVFFFFFFFLLKISKVIQHFGYGVSAGLPVVASFRVNRVAMYK